MPTKKPTPRRKAAAKLPTAITIREVEEAGPCEDEYLSRLVKLKCRPVAGGHYAEYAASYDIELPKRSLFGPDKPIPLTYVLTNDGYAFTWLLHKVPSLSKLAEAVEELLNHTDGDATVLAARHILGGVK